MVGSGGLASQVKTQVHYQLSSSTTVRVKYFTHHYDKTSGFTQRGNWDGGTFSISGSYPLCFR